MLHSPIPTPTRIERFQANVIASAFAHGRFLVSVVVTAALAGLACWAVGSLCAWVAMQIVSVS